MLAWPRPARQICTRLKTAMNDGHDHLDSELQRLIRGCPEPERLSDERRQAIWKVMAARLEQNNRSYRFIHSRALKWAVPVAAAAAILLAVGVWPTGDSRNGKPQPGLVYAFS